MQNTTKQNYPGSVTSYDIQPGTEVGLFYNTPETTRGGVSSSELVGGPRWLEKYFTYNTHALEWQLLTVAVTSFIYASKLHLYVQNVNHSDNVTI